MRVRRNIFVLPSGDDLRINEGIIGTHDEYEDRDDVVDDDVDGYDDIVVYRSCGGTLFTRHASHAEKEVLCSSCDCFLFVM